MMYLAQSLISFCSEDSMSSLYLVLFTCLALVVSWAKDSQRTKQALLVSYRSFRILLPNLLGMVGLIGLTLSVTPPRTLSHVFGIHGLLGFIVTGTIGALITIPAPIAYPLAGSLLKMGVGLPTLATFITTLTMVGTVTAPMEINYFGRRFTFVRQGLSLALAIVIGGFMGVILQ